MKTRAITSAAIVAAGIGLYAWTAHAQGTPDWAQVGPIFSENCTGCHGAGGRAGLDLSSYATAIAGSNNGAVLISGNPDDSLLVKRITGTVAPQMPRGGNPPLSQDQIDLIIAWITGGLTE